MKHGTYVPICAVCGEDITEYKEPFFYCVQRNHLLRTDQALENDQILAGLELLSLCTECIYRAMSVKYQPISETIRILDVERKELSRFAKWYTNGRGKWTPVNDVQAICSVCQRPIPLLDEYTRTEISIDVLIQDDEISSEEQYVLAIFCNYCSSTCFEIPDRA